jgi:endo-1,4-beta-xylanase
MKLSLVTVLSAAAVVSAIPVAEPEPVFDERQAAQSINDAFIAKGKKYFGTCADQGRLNTGSNSAIIKANFGQVTPENSYATPSNRTLGAYSRATA